MSNERQAGHTGSRPRREGSARAAYADLVKAGEIVEPRGCRPLPVGGPRLGGAVLAGPRGPGNEACRVPVTFVAEAAIVCVEATFACPADADTFRRGLRLRAGPSHGQALSAWAWRCLHDAIDHHLPAAARPYGDVRGDGIAKVLMGYVSGRQLDIAGLVGDPPPYERTVDCGDGHVWLRALGQGADTYVLRGPGPAATARLEHGGISFDAAPGAGHAGRFAALLDALGAGDGAHGPDLHRLGF